MLLSCLLGLTCRLVACSFAPPLSPLPLPPPLSTDSIGSVGVHGESVVTAILNNCSNICMYMYAQREQISIVVGMVSLSLGLLSWYMGLYSSS